MIDRSLNNSVNVYILADIFIVRKSAFANRLYVLSFSPGKLVIVT